MHYLLSLILFYIASSSLFYYSLSLVLRSLLLLFLSLILSSGFPGASHRFFFEISGQHTTLFLMTLCLFLSLSFYIFISSLTSLFLSLLLLFYSLPPLSYYSFKVVFCPSIQAGAGLEPMRGLRNGQKRS